MPALRLWPLVLAAALGIVPIGPQEHVHEATDESGHHTLIAHRHTQLHGLDASSSVERATLDHPDPIALFPDDAYTAPASYVQPMPLLSAALVPIPPATSVVDGQRRRSDQLIHAPPRAPSSLRGPPNSPFL